MMGAPDDPDPNGFDANCDGIDGDLSRAIFVADDGIDAQPGTREQPMRSIAAAIMRAMASSKTQILVSRGMYNETATITLVGGIGVYGGYDRRAMWSRGAFQSIVAVGAPVALEARGARNPLRIGRIEFRAADATMPGQTSIGLRAIDSPAIEVFDGAIISAGRGAPGALGMAGTAGTDGAPGGTGGMGNNDNETLPGNGGSGGMNTTCPMASGGEGGRGGRAPSFTGNPGVASASGSMGGAGYATTSCSPRGGDMGGSGAADGTPGAPGMGGAASGMVASDTGEYTGAVGTAGRDGAHGAGGGGGGGSSGQTSLACIDGAGNGGGGGGAGGCGGTGGRGGTGGGASIGVLALRSALTLRDCTVSTGGGGNGGAAGMGGTGGNASPVEIGTGGRGGDGRRGGAGGPGGGGGGGPSVGVWVEGAGRPTIDTVNFRLGPPGVGGSSSAAGMAEGRRGESRDVFPM